ncbi:hypothetical protein BDW22DRAFT_1488524 [Trametopsis cervina]|nr:hypothetical protein BDW22DRAFT_1488524 [Trametopsis cervina]
MPSAISISDASATAIHCAGLVDASLHSLELLEMTHLKMSRALIEYATLLRKFFPIVFIFTKYKERSPSQRLKGQSLLPSSTSIAPARIFRSHFSSGPARVRVWRRSRSDDEIEFEDGENGMPLTPALLTKSTPIHTIAQSPSSLNPPRSFTTFDSSGNNITSSRTRCTSSSRSPSCISTMVTLIIARARGGQPRGGVARLEPKWLELVQLDTDVHAHRHRGVVKIHFARTLYAYITLT